MLLFYILYRFTNTFLKTINCLEGSWCFANRKSFWNAIILGSVHSIYLKYVIYLKKETNKALHTETGQYRMKRGLG